MPILGENAMLVVLNILSFTIYISRWQPAFISLIAF